MLRGAVAILLVVGAFTPIGYFLIANDRAAGAVGPEQAQLIEPSTARPEPAERLTYLLAVAILPAGLFGLAWFTRRWDGGGSRWAVAGRLAAEGVLAVGLVAGCWAALAGDKWYHVSHHFGHQHPVIAVPLFLLAIAGCFWPHRLARWVRWTGWAVMLVTAVWVVRVSLFDERHPTASSYHFNAFFSAMVGVHQGRPLLVDSANQYGCYPQLLGPFFRLAGLDVGAVSLVFAALTAASYLAVWAGLVRVCRNPWIALLGCLAVVFFNWLMPMYLLGLDVYFQYRPLRILFPMLAFASAVHTYHHTSRRWYWLTLLGLAVGLLWNLDAGVPAVVAWLGGRALHAIARRPGWNAVRVIGTDVLAAAAAVLAVVTAYVGAVFLAYGAVPDLGRLLVFQRVFYLTGFFMLPMPFPGTWVPVAVVYLSGFYFAVRSALAGDVSPRAQAAFVLSVLGIAGFAYYQGRSHPFVLFLAAWPALPLAAVLLDELVSRPRRLLRPLHLTAAGMILWTLLGAAVGIPVRLPDIDRLSADKSHQGEDDSTGRFAEFIRRHAEPGEEVFIFSIRDGVLHHRTGTSSIAPCSFNELLRTADVAEVNRRFAAGRGTKLFVDRGCTVDDELLVRLHRSTLRQLELHRFEFVARCDQGEVWEYRPVSPVHGLAVGEVGQSLAHFRDVPLSDGPRLLPVGLVLPITLEVVVRPSADQQPYAVVLSNQALDGASGFSLVQLQPGTLTLVTADGERWWPSLTMPVLSGRWNHVSVVIDAHRARAFVNGRGVADCPTAGLPIRQSDEMIRVGDLPAGGREFRGQIRRWRVLSRCLSAEEISAEAALVDPGEADGTPVPTPEEWERRKQDPRLAPAVRWGDGFSFEEPSSLPGCRTFRWSQAEGHLRLVNTAFEPRRVRVRFTTVAATGPGALRVTGPGFDDTIPVSLVPGVFEQEFDLLPGPNLLRFRCDAPPHVHPVRTVVFAVHGLSVSPATGEPILRWEGGFSFEETSPTDPTHRFRWSNAESTLTVLNPTPDARRLKMTFVAAPFAPAPCSLQVAWSGGDEVLRLPAGANFGRTFEFPPGASVIRFRCDGEKSVSPARTVVFCLHRFSLAPNPDQ